MKLESELDTGCSRVDLIHNRALASIQSTIGFAPAPQEEATEDVEMAPEGGLPPPVEAKVMETNQAYVSILFLRTRTE